jgi:pimeloyl-ACP methyl ester carboxylesterase
MERSAVDGVALVYDVSGTGEPIAFIHGALIADAFRPVLSEPSLADHYRLITYYRRGYAGSGRAADSVSIARQAADCRALLQNLGVERAHVVGHSYGGIIALQFALDAPEVVHSLALLEPALTVGASGPAYRESLIEGGRRYREVGAATVVDEFLRARGGPDYRAELDRMIPGAFDQAVADAGATFDLDLPAFQDWHFGEAEAQRITQPVLAVLGGESDALSPRFVETYRWLLEWLPRAEGFVLPGANHEMQMQNPRGLADALAAFCARHPIPRQPIPIEARTTIDAP